MDSPQNSQNFKEDLTPIGLKLFHTEKQDGRHSKSFYETSITLIPKPDKDATHKRENCRLISLMNKEATILNKVQTNQVQDRGKRRSFIGI